ncbi:ABC transporter permease [Cellulomonas fimi]|uniref:ABC transporter permease subunit n=1 Tax=Cellulomonas fimi TaxID=1708 RepID=A0A7Y0LXT4_CELFI|nr:ABC transporter permease [Cellulomonas fimi]NMR19866.1 ABC transporter permease subunit [Cellulomonas fimi]
MPVVVRRLLVSLLVVLASTALMYGLVALSGNPLQDLLEYSGPDRDARIAARTAALDLDEPVPVRYALWLQDVGRCVVPGGGDCTLGLDRQSRPVLPQLGSALGSTLRLVAAATAGAMVVGVVAGVVSALRQYGAFDHAATLVAFVCFSLPVFWVSTLLKQYVAIDLNTWLGDPSLAYGTIVAIGLAAGAGWALLVGGSARRRALVLVVAAAATSSTLLALIISGWFRRPSLGVLGVAVSAVVAALLWSALLVGLRRRARPVLRGAIGSAVVGAAVVAVAQSRLADATWLTLGLVAVLVVALAALTGWALGGHARRAAAQVAALTGGTVVVLMVVDQLLRAYPALYHATDGRPVSTTGSRTPNLDGTFWETNLDLALHLVLPTIAVMLVSVATYTRFTRSGMLETLAQDHVRTARAGGLDERDVVVGHALRNALVPLVTLVAFDLAGILGGAVVVETVFGWNGLGRLFATGLANVDPNPVMAFFLVAAVATVTCNLLADLAYARLDPRIRLR